MRFVLRMILGMLIAPFLIGAAATIAMAPFALAQADGSLAVLCLAVVDGVIRSPAALVAIPVFGVLLACGWRALDRRRRHHPAS